MSNQINYIYRLVTKKLAHLKLTQEEREDAIQEVLAYYYQRRNDYDASKAGETTYIYYLVLGGITQWQRKRSQDQLFSQLLNDREEEYSEEHLAIFSDNSDMEKEIIRKEETETLLARLKHLAEKNEINWADVLMHKKSAILKLRECLSLIS